MPGASSFTAQVTDANGKTGTAVLSIAVLSPPTITTVSFTDGYVGSPYSASVAGSGGKMPYAFAVTAGALPGGVALSSGGALTGTPTATGTAMFTVTLTDANGVTATKPLALAV